MCAGDGVGDPGVGGGVAPGVVPPGFHGPGMGQKPLSLPPYPPPSPPRARARVVMSVLGPAGHCACAPPL